MIGETVAIRGKTGITRIVRVLDRTVKDGLPYYIIRDETTLKQSEAEVKPFEATFKVFRGLVKPRHYKGSGPKRQKRGKR
ncbi:hypothetical protein CK934_28075 [Chitinophaga sp. MD30]|nr:hypothetical protein CK934_28075 [Chitinophaga sp. MD30]